jgi:hypothetical protein
MAAQLKTTLSFCILMLVSPYESVREHRTCTATRVFPSSLRLPMGACPTDRLTTSNERLTAQHPAYEEETLACEN